MTSNCLKMQASVYLLLLLSIHVQSKSGNHSNRSKRQVLGVPNSQILGMQNGLGRQGGAMNLNNLPTLNQLVKQLGRGGGAAGAGADFRGLNGINAAGLGGRQNLNSILNPQGATGNGGLPDSIPRSLILPAGSTQTLGPDTQSLVGEGCSANDNCITVQGLCGPNSDSAKRTMKQGVRSENVCQCPPNLYVAYSVQLRGLVCRPADEIRANQVKPTNTATGAVPGTVGNLNGLTGGLTSASLGGAPLSTLGLGRIGRGGATGGASGVQQPNQQGFVGLGGGALGSVGQGGLGVLGNVGGLMGGNLMGLGGLGRGAAGMGQGLNLGALMGSMGGNAPLNIAGLGGGIGGLQGGIGGLGGFGGLSRGLLGKKK